MKERDSQQPSGHSRAMVRFWHSQDEIFIQARKDRRQNTARANMERATINVKVLPLAGRGATTEEIHQILGFEKYQVNNALAKARARHVFPRPSREQTRRARRQAYIEKFPQEEKCRFALAKRMIDEKLIGDDISSWKDLNLLYEKNKRKLPENFVDKIILELYVSIIKGLKQGKTKLSIGYTSLFNENGFRSVFEQLRLEKGFLLAKLLTDWADGEDETGFFKLEGDKKTRHIENDTGKLVYDSSEFRIKRLLKPLSS